MNKSEMESQKREQRRAFFISLAGFALTFACWHFGWFEALNPFDGK